MRVTHIFVHFLQVQNNSDPSIFFGSDENVRYEFSFYGSSFKGTIMPLKSMFGISLSIFSLSVLLKCKGLGNFNCSVFLKSSIFIPDTVLRTHGSEVRKFQNRNWFFSRPALKLSTSVEHSFFQWLNQVFVPIHTYWVLWKFCNF